MTDISSNTQKLLIDSIYLQLKDAIGEKKFHLDNLIELVAIGIQIINKVKKLSYIEKKAILISVLEQYVENDLTPNDDASDEILKASLISIVDVSFDVLHDFKDGKFRDAPKKKCSGECTLYYLSVIAKYSVSVLTIMLTILSNRKK